MNKRLLAKMPVAELDAQQLGLFDQAAEQIGYIAHGRTMQLEGKEILLLTFFPRRHSGEEAKAVFRTFIGQDDYITQDLTCQQVKWKTGSLESIVWKHTQGNRWWYCDWCDRTILADAETVESINRMTGCTNPLPALREHQNEIIGARLDAKHRKIEDRIDTAMALFPELPDDFTDWLNMEAFGSHRFLIYNNDPKKKVQTVLCNTCMREFERAKPRHNQEHVCPNCGRRAVFKSVRKAQGTLKNEIQTAVFLPWSGGFCIRYFYATRDDTRLLETRKWDCKMREEYRETYAGGECDMYNYGKFLSTNTYRWGDNKQGLYFNNAVVYYRNLSQLLKGTPWEYSGLKEYAARANGAGVPVARYLDQYPKMPYLEYLAKLRLFRLIKSLLDWGADSDLNMDGKTAAAFLSVPADKVAMVQDIDPDTEDLKTLRRCFYREIPVTTQLFRHAAGAYHDNAQGVLFATKYASMQRIDRYLAEHRKDDRDFGHTVRLWVDYIDCCEKLGYDLRNDFVLFPRHLKQSHDAAIDRYKELKKHDRKGLLDGMTERMKEELAGMQRRFGFLHAGMVIMAPTNLNEIVAEGQKLRHCVGLYDERMAKGETVILFLRRASQPEKPCFTIEVKHGKVAQCRGFRNCPAPDEVQDFMKVWERKCLRRAAA